MDGMHSLRIAQVGVGRLSLVGVILAILTVVVAVAVVVVVVVVVVMEASRKPRSLTEAQSRRSVTED